MSVDAIAVALDEGFAVYGRFVTGRTVNCALWNGITETTIPISPTVCNEISNTGIYKFISDDITTPLTERTEIVWQMTDSVTGLTDEGYIIVGDITSQRSHDLWQDAGLDSGNPKTILENTEGADYDEDVSAIHKDVVRVGDTTTITRT